MDEELTAEEEYDLIELVADFAERVRDDEPVRVEDYLARCHSEAMKRRFKKMAGVSQLVALGEDLAQSAR